MLALAAVSVVLVLLGVPGVIRGQAAVRERVDRRAAAPPGRWVQAGDTELHVLESGPASGRPVVLIHGSGAWGGTWRGTSSVLADAGYRVVAVDVPPFGYSERPANGDYTTEAQARRIESLLVALDLGEVTLVGHSFGGLATVETALRSARVSRLVLIDVALGLSEPGGSSPVVDGVLRVGPLRDTLVAATFTNPWFLPYGVRSFVADPAVVTDAVVAMYRAPLDVTGTTVAIGRWVPELVAPSTSPAAADPASYARIHVPTLVLWGREDQATPLAQGEQLHALIAGSQWVVLDDTGHLPQIEDPAAVNRALLAFLRPVPYGRFDTPDELR